MNKLERYPKGVIKGKNAEDYNPKILYEDNTICLMEEETNRYGIYNISNQNIIIQIPKIGNLVLNARQTVYFDGNTATNEIIKLIKNKEFIIV